MISALVFDVGDTILPVWKLCRKSLHDMRKKDVPQALLSEYYKEAVKPMPNSWNAHGNLRIIEQVIRNTGYDYNAQKIYKMLLKTYWKNAKDFYKKEGAKTVAAIRLAQNRYKIGILSNNSHLGGVMFLKTAPFRVDASVFSEDIKAEKPRKKAFDAIIKKMGTNPRDILYFGNNPKSDAPASRYGINFVYVYGISEYSKNAYSGYKIRRIAPQTVKRAIRHFVACNTQATRAHNT